MKRSYLFLILILLGFSAILGSCTRSASEDKNEGIFPTPFAPSPDPHNADMPEYSDLPGQTIQPAISLIETGFMGENLLIFSLGIREDMKNDFYGKVQDEEYECTRQEELPDRLYCFGKIPENRQNPIFILFSCENNKMIWQTAFEYPDMNNQ